MAILRKSFFVFFILISVTAFCQDTTENGVTDVTTATFFAPGFSYEKKLATSQTLYARAFLSTSVYFSYSDALGTSAGINFYPSFSLQYRYYYNAPQRIQKGKRTEMNSLNYLGAVAEGYFFHEMVSFNGDKELRANKSVGVVWGLQRNYNNRFSIDLSIGPGITFGKETTVTDAGNFETKNAAGFTVVGQFAMGFWLNRRN